MKTQDIEFKDNPNVGQREPMHWVAESGCKKDFDKLIIIWTWQGNI